MPVRNATDYYGRTYGCGTPIDCSIRHSDVRALADLYFAVYTDLIDSYCNYEKLYSHTEMELNIVHISFVFSALCYKRHHLAAIWRELVFGSLVCRCFGTW